MILHMRALLMLLMAICTTRAVLGADWQEVSVDEDGYYFLDADSIKAVKGSSGLIQVWVKAMFEDNDKLKNPDGQPYELNKIVAQEIFDCTKSQYRMVQVISYDETDTIQDSNYSKDPMKNITPNSNDEDAYKVACNLWGQRKAS